MKKILCALSLVWSVCALTHAQQFPYQFAYSNETYVPLTGGIPLDQNELWDFGVDIPLGFDFQFGGETINVVVLDGYSGALFTKNSIINDDSTDAILGYTTSAGLAPKINTACRYLTTGTAPNRIAKIEMYRVGFEDVFGEVSLQFWLYESSNAIQIRLGNQVIVSPVETFFNKKSPLIGYMLNYQYLSDEKSVFPQAQFVTGDPVSPTDTIVVNDILDESLYDGPQYGPTAIPLDFAVFTFTPGMVSTKQPTLSAFRISPNPAQDVIRLEGLEGNEAAQVQLLNEQGRIMAALEMPAGEHILHLPVDLEPGLYLLRYTSGGRSAVSKLLKV